MVIRYHDTTDYHKSMQKNKNGFGFGSEDGYESGFGFEKNISIKK
jgi:hypothetical protein